MNKTDVRYLTVYNFTVEPRFYVPRLYELSILRTLCTDDDVINNSI